LANLYSKNKWKYQDASSLLSAIEKSRQLRKEQELLNLKNKQKKDQFNNIIADDGFQDSLL
jgi:hypothetical protein